MNSFHAETATRIFLVVGLAGVLFNSRLAAQPIGDSAGSIPIEIGDTAASRPPASGDVGRWISELNHDAYSVRQAAAASLLSAGMIAREPLISLANGPDPETRTAARRLISIIDRSEFERRLAAFAADTDGRQRLMLPGWGKFREVVGDDPAARALFVEMQRREGGLIAAAFGASDQSPEELLEGRAMRLLQWPAIAGNRNTTPPLGSCAAMLFLATVPRAALSENGAMFVARLVESPPIRASLQTATPQDAVRRLAVYWIVNCPNRSEMILGRRLGLISNLGIEEGLPLVLAAAVKDPQLPSVSPFTRASAVIIAGQLGRPEAVDRLEPLLDDSSICLTGNVQPGGQPVGIVQVRDVALAVLLQLTHQQPADYGYTNARMISPQRIYQLNTLSRDNDQQRAASIAKWREWRAAEKRSSQAIN